MRHTVSLTLGFAGAFAARALLVRAVLGKLERDISRLNQGEHGPLLAGYSQDAVLHFNDGTHRWAGEHRGKPAIEHFLREFTRAGIHGRVRALWVGGPPWAMTLVVRFDDWASSPAGEEIYANRTMLLARTRWGRIVEQEDFYEDTGRILEFEQRLRGLGVEPLPRRG